MIWLWLDGCGWTALVGRLWLDGCGWTAVVGRLWLDGCGWTAVAGRLWLDGCGWTAVHCNDAAQIVSTVPVPRNGGLLEKVVDRSHFPDRALYYSLMTSRYVSVMFPFTCVYLVEYAPVRPIYR